MSLIDRFYEKNNIYVIVKVSTPLQIPTKQDGFIIEKTGLWEYTIRFQHNNYDLVMILDKIGCLKQPMPISQQNCYLPDFMWIRFFRHLHALYSSPFYRPLEQPEYEYFTGILKKKDVTRVLDTQEAITGRKLRFSSFLCALHIYLYHQVTKCDFCKVQILSYLPWIQGKNKVFADVLHIPVLGKSIFEITNTLEAERYTNAELYSIYRTYDILSSLTNVEKIDLPHFDICFSNFPFPLLFYTMSIVKKKIQFENSYVQIISNQNDDIFFNFVNDLHTCPMKSVFYHLSKTLINSM